MIDRPLPSPRRSRSERLQRRARVAIGLGLLVLLMPLFMPPAHRHAFDYLLSLGWCLVALGAYLRWRVPVATPASLARDHEAELVAHRRVRPLSDGALASWRGANGSLS